MQQLDVAIMTCNKQATVDQKNKAVADAIKLKDQAEDAHPTLPPFAAHLAWFTDNSPLGSLRGTKRGQFLSDVGIEYPFIKKSEPGKEVHLLTGDGQRPVMVIAELIHFTSLHQVDRFFMQVAAALQALNGRHSIRVAPSGNGTSTASTRRIWWRRCW